MSREMLASQRRPFRASSLTETTLQRKCVCGQHSVAGGDRPGCRDERSSLQRNVMERPGLLQRCAGRTCPPGTCSHEDGPTLQRRAPESAAGVPPIVHEVLRSPGQPLDAETRAFMEPRFGHDFSRIRTHTDVKAAESARSVKALAYTVGPHIVFGSRQYEPQTEAGRSLLAHELVHTIQQSGLKENSILHPMAVGDPDDQYERAAESVSSQVLGDPYSGVSMHRSPRSWGPILAARLQRTCAQHTNESFYRTAWNYCADSATTGQLHPGQRCYRQVPARSGMFDCPPGDQVCFDSEGHCHDSWDDASPVGKRKPDGTCELHNYCMWIHGWKDKVPQTWWDQNVTPIFERMGRRQIECIQACQALPWWQRGFCLQGCSPTPAM